jgi:hypothetical protein
MPRFATKMANPAIISVLKGGTKPCYVHCGLIELHEGPLSCRVHDAAHIKHAPVPAGDKCGTVRCSPVGAGPT